MDARETAALLSSRELSMESHDLTRKWSKLEPLMPPNWFGPKGASLFNRSGTKVSTGLENKGVHDRFLISPRPEGLVTFGMTVMLSFFYSCGQVDVAKHFSYMNKSGIASRSLFSVHCCGMISPGTIDLGFLSFFRQVDISWRDRQMLAALRRFFPGSASSVRSKFY